MSVLSQFSRELEELVARTAPSVVGVEHRSGQGSGVFISSDGHLITNSHVVRNAEKLRVRLGSGHSEAARILGDDPATDLAVIKTSSASVPYLPLVETRRLRVGQLVVAIGNPLWFDRSVSLGVVSALERSLPGPGERPFEGLIQTDAAINPGNSGGPLVDAEGSIVGINTAVIPHARGIGFAIPAHTAAWVTAVLMQKGRIERPYLGISARGEELLAQTALEVGQSRAVRVHGVGADSPAAAAGIRRGDLLLVANGSAVFSVDDLQRVLVLSGKDAIKLELLRGSERRAVDASPRKTVKAA